MPAADVVVNETGAGHDNVGEPDVGDGVGVGVGLGVGDVGLLLHAADTTIAIATMKKERRIHHDGITCIGAALDLIRGDIGAQGSNS
jgi:hypothetical protein